MSRKPIKLYLLTGFLGAGKTTFLKQIIASLANNKIGILMNEFGKISVDGVLLQQNGVDIVELNNGSVFCSCLKGAFIDALITYSELPIEYLFVEASGMADPSSIEHILNSIIGKVKGQKYDYQGAICVVDALNFLDQVDVLLPIERQIAASSFIMLNKVDLIDSQVLSEVEQKIRSINSEADLLKTKHCEGGLDFLQRTLKNVSGIGSETCCNTPANRPVAHILSVAGSFDREKFMAFLQSLVPWTLRIKGFFQLKDGWMQVDMVGSQIDVKPTDITRTVSELVIISTQGLPALQEIYMNWDKSFAVEMSLN
jgi:G3E family GTPase